MFLLFALVTFDVVVHVHPCQIHDTLQALHSITTMVSALVASSSFFATLAALVLLVSKDIIEVYTSYRSSSVLTSKTICWTSQAGCWLMHPDWNGIRASFPHANDIRSSNHFLILYHLLNEYQTPAFHQGGTCAPQLKFSAHVLFPAWPLSPKGAANSWSTINCQISIWSSHPVVCAFWKMNEQALAHSPEKLAASIALSPGFAMVKGATVWAGGGLSLPLPSWMLPASLSFVRSAITTTFEIWDVAETGLLPTNKLFSTDTAVWATSMLESMLGLLNACSACNVEQIWLNKWNRILNKQSPLIKISLIWPNIAKYYSQS